MLLMIHYGQLSLPSPSKLLWLIGSAVGSSYKITIERQKCTYAFDFQLVSILLNYKINGNS